MARLIIALVAGAALGWAISSCGSGGSGTASEQAGQAVSTAKSQAEGKVKTTTEKGQTTTATAPAETKTVTTTKTEKAPAPSATVTNQTTNVQAAPATTAGDESSDGLPWWGWVLIGLGVVAIGSAIFAVGRNRGRRKPPDAPAGPTHVTRSG